MMLWITLYCVIGAAWAYWGTNKFYQTSPEKFQEVSVIPSNIINCFLFPIGMITRTFAFIVSNKETEGDVTKVGIGIVLTRFTIQRT